MNINFNMNDCGIVHLKYCTAEQTSVLLPNYTHRQAFSSLKLYNTKKVE